MLKLILFTIFPVFVVFTFYFTMLSAVNFVMLLLSFKLKKKKTRQDMVIA